MTSRDEVLAAIDTAQAQAEAAVAAVEDVRVAFLAFDGGVVPPPVPVPPTVTVSGPTTLPAPGSATYTAAATADPTRTVAKIDFQVDGATVATDLTSPWAASVTLTNGSHQIRAMVTDSAGVTAISTPLVVTVGPAPAPLKDFDQDVAAFSSGWQQGTYAGAYKGSDRYASTAGSTAVVTVTGTQLVIWGTKDAHHGTAAVTVDGGAPRPASFKAPSRQENAQILALTGLAAGEHVVTIKANGDGTIALDRFQTDGTITAPVLPPSPDPPTPPTGGLKVARVGNYMVLTDAAGVRKRQIGTNQYMDSYNSSGDMTPVSNWTIANRDKLAAEWAGYGINMVRIPTNNDRSSGYIARLRQLTDALAAKGIRSVLCPFGGVSWQPSQANGLLVGDQWVALGKPVHVLCETVNEPNPGAYSDTPSAWLAGNQAEIAAIRGKGYTQPIMVGCRSWCWTIPVAEAKVLAAQDSQLIFMSHRYAFDGSSNRPASDAQAWTNEWKAAADQGLCVGVGECGWYNGGGAFNQPWLQAMMDAQLKGLQDGWLSAAISWIYLWDAGSQVSGVSGGDWWDIAGMGEAWKLNQWGTIAASSWSKMAALP